MKIRSTFSNKQNILQEFEYLPLVAPITIVSPFLDVNLTRKLAKDISQSLWSEKGLGLSLCFSMLTSFLDL